ncbi:MAG: gamma-glutamyltransferase [Betaproteobacteria bacterium]|nr:MAG: gamma-glutamyltransferase [Betaproteobacteria bacterium]
MTNTWSLFAVRSWILVVALSIFAATFASGARAAPDECAIASAHPLATDAGCEIIAQGGNAFDAAVAVTAALGVVEPYASGLGGGGFYLLHRADDGFEVFIDARETAPGQADATKYLDADGEPVADLSRRGPTAAGIPGIPAALEQLTQKYGSLPLSRTLAPAIRLAENGFKADSRYVRVSGWMVNMLNRFPESAAVYLHDGAPVAQGHVIRQKQLAETLRRIATGGSRVFYQGPMARQMVQSVRSSGGYWTMEDLANYRVVEREPQRFGYRGARITTAPLPSSGGLVMAQTLQILDALNVEAMSEDDRTHVIIEAMRRAYNDRARFMGDQDFVNVPVDRLASRAYAQERAQSIDLRRATPSSELPSIYDVAEEGTDTTHFSIVDADGNRVAATLSINGPFGAGFVAGDTGVLLNNHMDDFAIALASPNLYKLVGNAANAVEPGKRPLSSMSPTFVENERGILVLGTPGGSRIISMVMIGIIDYLGSGGADARDIVSLPRYHHQYLPDRVQVEPDSFSDEWIEALRSRGHEVEIYRRKWGNMQAVFVDAKTGERQVGNDPRGREGVVF